MRKWRDNEAAFWTLSNIYNLLNANPTKWSNTLKQFVGRLPTNHLRVFHHFVGLALKGLSVKILHSSVSSHKNLRIVFRQVNPISVFSYNHFDKAPKTYVTSYSCSIQHFYNRKTIEHTLTETNTNGFHLKLYKMEPEGTDDLQCCYNRNSNCGFDEISQMRTSQQDFSSAIFLTALIATC